MIFNKDHNTAELGKLISFVKYNIILSNCIIKYNY